MNSVSRAVSSQEVPEDGKLLAWANKEAIPVLRQARAALNAEFVGSTDVTTDGAGTLVTIFTSEAIPTNGAWLVEARVVGFGTGVYAAYVLRGLFRNDAGTVAQVGTTSSDYSEESAAGCNATLSTSGGLVLVQVRDDGATVMDYNAVIKIARVRQSGA